MLKRQQSKEKHDWLTRKEKDFPLNLNYHRLILCREKDFHDWFALILESLLSSVSNFFIGPLSFTNLDFS